MNTEHCESYSNPFYFYEKDKVKTLNFSPGKHLYAVFCCKNHLNQNGKICGHTVYLQHLVFADSKDHVIELLKEGCIRKIQNHKNRIKEYLLKYGRKTEHLNYIGDEIINRWRIILYWCKYGKFRDARLYQMQIESFNKPAYFFKAEF